jgi:hypothetical protein
MSKFCRERSLRPPAYAWLNEGSSTRFGCQRRAAVRAVVDSDPAAAGLRGDSNEPPACLRPPFESQIEVARPRVCLEECAARTEAGGEQRSALETERPIRVFVRSCHRPIVPPGFRRSEAAVRDRPQLAGSCRSKPRGRIRTMCNVNSEPMSPTSAWRPHSRKSTRSPCSTVQRRCTTTEDTRRVVRCSVCTKRLPIGWRRRRT